ncbi:hypothetical protein [Paenibacillus yonginensis]|uniref:hypothetical protein n=1 Tax=Paenibacillus yonginensis TaxID=1462996 RepID=UPI00124711B9|nr:hypothetical protein [Paenibacillus yonginensis]
MTVSVYSGSGSVEPTAGPVGMVPGVPSPAFPIAVGANRIELTVAAPDTSVSKYTIFLTRAAEATPDQPPVVLPPSGGDPVPERSAPQPPPIAEPQDVQILLDGSQTPELGGLASGSIAEVDGRTVATVKLDAVKLQGVLNQLGTAENPEVAVASVQAADQFRFELPKALLATLRSWHGGTMEQETPLGGLRLPFSELGTFGRDNLQEGAEVSSGGGVTVLLSRSAQDTLERMQRAAGPCAYTSALGCCRAVLKRERDGLAFRLWRLCCAGNSAFGRRCRRWNKRPERNGWPRRSYSCRKIAAGWLFITGASVHQRGCGQHQQLEYGKLHAGAKTSGVLRCPGRPFCGKSCL